MHFVQQYREFLNLVDDHEGRFGHQRFADQRRVAREPEKKRLIEQVVHRAAGKLLADQRGLAGLTGSEQKAGLARQHGRDPEMARHFGRGH